MDETMLKPSSGPARGAKREAENEHSSEERNLIPPNSIMNASDDANPPPFRISGVKIGLVVLGQGAEDDVGECEGA